jgi:hypothetical protein
LKHSEYITQSFGVVVIGCLVIGAAIGSLFSIYIGMGNYSSTTTVKSFELCLKNNIPLTFQKETGRFYLWDERTRSSFPVTPESVQEMSNRLREEN